MATKKQAINTSLKKYAEPRNKTGKGGFKDNPENRNAAGQRSAAVVRTAAEYRDYLIDVMHKKLNTPPSEDASYMEVMAFTQVRNAVNDPAQREDLLNRIWGKATQQINVRNLTDEQLLAALAAGQVTGDDA